MSNERLVAAANQFKRLLLDNKLLVVAVVCTTVYLGILDKVLESEAMKLDEAAYWLIVENLRQPWLTPIMESFSNLATPVTIVVLWVLVTAFAPGRKALTATTSLSSCRTSCIPSIVCGSLCSQFIIKFISNMLTVEIIFTPPVQLSIWSFNDCYGIFRLACLVRVAL